MYKDAKTGWISPHVCVHLKLSSEVHSAIAPTPRSAVLHAMAGAKLGGTQLVVLVTWHHAVMAKSTDVNGRTGAGKR